MVLANYVPSGADYGPAELTSLQVAFDFLKVELRLQTEEDRRRIARLVLAAYDHEGRRPHRIISAVMRVCRSAEPNEAWGLRASGLAKTLSDLADEMDAADPTRKEVPWKGPVRAGPDKEASP